MTVDAGTLVVSPAAATVDVGRSTVFVASLKDDAGDVVPNAPVIWRSLNTSVALVTPAGVVTGVRATSVCPWQTLHLVQSAVRNASFEPLWVAAAAAGLFTRPPADDTAGLARGAAARLGADICSRGCPLKRPARESAATRSPRPLRVCRPGPTRTTPRSASRGTRPA